MKETTAIRLVNEWHRLHAKKVTTDHEIAKLCFDIKKEYTGEDPGNAKMCDFIVSRIGVTHKAALGAVRKADAWDCVRDVEHWRTIGGLPSALFIAKLNKKQRMVVLSESLKKADEKGKPLSERLVREIAWTHGFVTKEPVRVTDAKKAAVLTAFINRLYSVVGNLPTMPPEVREIVSPRKAASKQKLAA